MKKAYLGISFSNRKKFDKEIETLRSILQKEHCELFVFVDHYHFQPHEEKEMMATAFQEIDSSDVFIAELTTKAIGVGIEVGYAFAKGIPVIYIRKKGSDYSTTVSGCADQVLVYEDVTDLKDKLSMFMKI
ncbi:nucleoside 2-deoxyribosyltransferase [Flammeovirga sp. OC4]|uniref:nucleoside 2-deoxyribosyltransferase n=1 Tax=Flammeovirga sp. OC4 TaxID=1382345 RepID=UPI0005C46AA9|nr:nucleoside 2-deoxyribosyltransferase [Flammeovirga sp. OC4]